VHYAPNIFGVRFKIRLVYRRTTQRLQIVKCWHVRNDNYIVIITIIITKIYIFITFVDVELNLHKIIFGVDFTQISHWLIGQ